MPGPPDAQIRKNLSRTKRKADESDENYIARLIRAHDDLTITLASYDRTFNSEPEPDRRIQDARDILRHRKEIVAALGIKDTEEEL